MPDSASKNASSACLAEQIAMADRRCPLADVMPGDLDIAAHGQLSPTQIGSKRLRYE